MISNPITFFISGNLQEQFTYEGGTQLFQFSPNDNNLSKYRDCNVIFFANSEEHGLDVLKRMFQFAIDCKSKYLANKEDKSVNWEEFKEIAESNLEAFTQYRDAIIEGKVKLQLAPSNQFYKVGWASNDTI